MKPLKIAQPRIKQSWMRDAALSLVISFEKNNLPGAWRLGQWFSRQDFARKLSAGPIACTTRHGVDIVIDPLNDRGVEDSIFRTGTYEPGTLHVINHVLKAGDRFVDVGANVGLMSLVAARRVGPTGRVDCFEPLPEIRQLLQASISINKLKNLTVHPIALGSNESIATISRHLEVNRGSASLAWAGETSDQLEVRIARLDDVLPDSRTHPPAMIKIDVEGWEFEVLKGSIGQLSGEDPPVLCVEFSRQHPLQGGTAEDMFELLISLGYGGHRLTGTKSEPSPLIEIDIRSIPDHDNIFFFPKRSRPASATGLKLLRSN